MLVTILFALSACGPAEVPTAARVPIAPPTPTIAQAIAPTRAPLATATSVPITLPTATGLAAAFKEFSSNVQIEIQGEFIVLRSNGIPPHPSPYFARNDNRYQAYDGSNSNYRQNPNLIREQSLVLMIPLHPRPDDRHAPTPLGPIGMALDGVALFNQYAGPNQPLTNEINSFDQFNGHPEQQGLYHYHIEPLFLTATFGKETLIGFLLDAFPYTVRRRMAS